MPETRHLVADEQWEHIEARLPARKGHHGDDQRIFFNALLWLARTGAPWRDLPARMGKWNVVYQRLANWCKKGHFEGFFRQFSNFN